MGFCRTPVQGQTLALATKAFQSLLLATELLISSMSAGCTGYPVTMHVGRSLLKRPEREGGKEKNNIGKKRLVVKRKGEIQETIEMNERDTREQCGGELM
jgi:hypothetical protein